MNLNLTSKITSWNFYQQFLKLENYNLLLLHTDQEENYWKPFQWFCFSSLPPCTSLMQEWLHLMLTVPTDCVGLFACVVLWYSSAECSIKFIITPSQNTDIPNKQQPEAANPAVAVLVCINGFSSQVCHYPAVLPFETKSAAKVSALHLC